MAGFFNEPPRTFQDREHRVKNGRKKSEQRIILNCYIYLIFFKNNSMRLIKTGSKICNFLKNIVLDFIRVKDENIKREMGERQYQAALKKKKCLLDSRLYEIDVMDGKDFEKYLELGFRKLGYAVKLTPKSKDYGADLILYKDGVTIAVQAKREERPVGISAVQQVTSAIKYYNADQGMVITNNYFTIYACKLARSNEIELWDRKKLIAFMRIINSNVPPENDKFS